MGFLGDSTWSEKGGSRPFQIGLATFGILALELAIIRWASGQIRILAYFNNLILISAFLGMGLGIGLARRWPGLVHGALPALFVLSLAFAFSGPLRIMRMSFPDTAVNLWGAESHPASFFHFASSLVKVLLLFCGHVAVFLFAGGAVGHLFPRMPVLRAYTADLVGSLLGIAAFTAATFVNAGPPVWLALGAAPFALLSRRLSSLLAFAGVVGLGIYSIQGAIFSPYNRIDIESRPYRLMLRVNQDFHQYMHDLSDKTINDPLIPEADRLSLQRNRMAYDLPFVLNDQRDRALIVGAGTGNDVMAALRNGYQIVDSVDIDPLIIEEGRRLHPQKPYSDPRAHTIVNDARAFFEQDRGPAYDVICYGLLDSHAMFSAMSTLRLDNYVYTEEGIRAAWRRVAPGGHLSLSFSIFAGGWISDRLYWTIAKATGIKPIMIFHQMQFGCTYVVPREEASLHLDRAGGFPIMQPGAEEKGVRTTSDDWPFLYMRPGVFPWGYVLVLAGVLLIALFSIRWAYGKESLGGGFDTVLFLMGAAFLLIETRGVTTMSLLFGSTWMVNSAIFAGILLMALIANLAVERFGFTRLEPWFGFLLLAVLIVWGFDNAWLNHFSLPVRGLLGGLITALPIGFAGVIVSILLARSANPAASLGSNLLGSVLGGCLEYSSMYVGLRALALFALALYLLAMMRALRQEKGGAAVAS